MPTIDELGAVTQALSTADEIPISQQVGGQWVVSKTSLGALFGLLGGLAVLPPGVMTGTGAPLNNQGLDGWGFINATTGDVYERAAGVWTKTGSIVGPRGLQGVAGAAYSLAALASVLTMAGTDEVGIVQGGNDKIITLQNMLNGETIDLLVASAAASDTDTFMTGQGGGNVLTRQTLAGLWSWIVTHLPGYKVPVLEITANLTVDATYNGKILVVTGAAVVISPNFSLMGSGFECEIVTSGAGTVVWGSGVTATNGASGMPVSSYSKLLAFASSAGSVVMASVGVASGSGVSVPGTPSGLTFGSATATTLAFTWSAPSSGGSATYYQVQYRLTGTSTWTSAPGTAILSQTLTGLTQSSEYDVQVAAGNSAGLSAFTGTVTGITSSSLLAPPGIPTGLAVGAVTTTTAALSWGAPSSGGAVATYTVQYRVTSVGGAWTQVTGISATSATITGLTAGTQYDFQVFAVNAGGTGSPTATANGATSASGGTTAIWGPSNGYMTTLALGSTGNIFNVEVTGGTAPTSVAIGFSSSQSVPPSPMPAVSDGWAGNFNGNYWGTYMHAPPSAGTWYGWAIGYASGSPVFTIVGAPITVS